MCVAPCALDIQRYSNLMKNNTPAPITIDTLLGYASRDRARFDAQIARLDAELALAEAAAARGETIEQFLAARGGK